MHTHTHTHTHTPGLVFIEVEFNDEWVEVEMRIGNWSGIPNLVYASFCMLVSDFNLCYGYIVK